MAPIKPELPIDEGKVQRVGDALTDIITKLDRIRAINDLDVDIKLPALPSLDEIKGTADAFADEEAKVKALQKAWLGMGNVAAAVLRRKREFAAQEKDLVKGMDEQKKKIDEINKLEEEHTPLTEKQQKDREEHIRQLERMTKALELNREGMKQLSYQSSLTSAALQKVTKAAVSFAESALTAGIGIAIQLATAGFKMFVSLLKNSYELLERYTQAFGAMGQAIGGATPQLGRLQNAADALYNSALGRNLGMSIGQAAVEMSTLSTTVGILGRDLTDNAVNLITHAKALGLSTAEAGELYKMYMMMGGGMKETDAAMNQVRLDSAKLGVASAVLAKNLLVAGKNLLALTSPNMQKSMQETVNKMYAMGIAAQTVDKFTNMTDSFEKTAGAMAKLNTMYGTHINALEMFAEQDPGKRWKMLEQGMKAAGLSLNNLSRAEKQLIGDTLGLASDEVNALITGGEKGLKKHQEMAKSWDQTVAGVKSTIVAWAQLGDQVMKAIMVAFAPILEVFGLNFGKAAGQVKSFGEQMSEMAKGVAALFQNLAKDTAPGGFVESVKMIAAEVKIMWEELQTWVKSGSFKEAIIDVMHAFRQLPGVIKPVIDMITGGGMEKAVKMAAWFLENIRWIAAAFIGMKVAIMAVSFAKLLVDLGLVTASYAGLALVKAAGSAAAAPIIGWPIALGLLAAAAAVVGGGAYLAMGSFSGSGDKDKKMLGEQSGEKSPDMSTATAETQKTMVKRLEQDKKDVFRDLATNPRTAGKPITQEMIDREIAPGQKKDLAGAIGMIPQPDGTLKAATVVPTPAPTASATPTTVTAAPGPSYAGTGRVPTNTAYAPQEAAARAGQQNGQTIVHVYIDGILSDANMKKVITEGSMPA